MSKMKPLPIRRSFLALLAHLLAFRAYSHKPGQINRMNQLVSGKLGGADGFNFDHHRAHLRRMKRIHSSGIDR
jgi:hypothetical protein